MMLHGEITREGRHHSAIVEVLGAYGVGKTREAAIAALVDIVTELATQHGPLNGFKVTVTDDHEQTLYLTSNDPLRLLAMLLREQRTSHEMSLADVAAKAGAKSRNGYAQYEQGKTEPTITKLQELLDVVAPELVIAVVPRTARIIPRWDEEADAAELDEMVHDPAGALERLKAMKRRPARKAG